MSLKAMLGLFSSGHHAHRMSGGGGAPPPSPGRRTFCATLMEENIATAEAVITPWDPSLPSSAVLPSLFTTDRDESRRFLRSVSDLQQAMLFFASDDSSASPASARSAALVRAQTLMQSAMRRLEREFYHILSSNRDRLDPDSVSRSRSTRSAASSFDPEEDDDDAGDSIGEVERASAVATDDLRAIADAMVSAGYGRECVRIYRLLRKSIVDEGLYRLGFERLTASQLQKLDWEVLDLKIRSWLAASRVAVRTLFSSERILCDHVFSGSGSDSIREATFAEIARDSAAQFLAFPESVAKITRRSPEKLFRILDLYDTFIDLWPDVESVFSFAATSAVRSQALTSLLKLAEAARATLSDFEAAIQKDATKPPAAAAAGGGGGGVHPLTRYVMNYLVFLADYEESLADIFADFPFHPPTALPEGGGGPPSPGTPTAGSFSTRAAWLVLVLLCKMDGKAEEYKEVALSYLFLANNLQYVVGKVAGGRLRPLLGEQWVVLHQAKVRHYVASYERLAWSKVAATIPSAEVAPAEARDRMRGFAASFEEAAAAHAGWVVADRRVREEVRASVSSMIVPAYRAFYERCREELREAAVVRFAPEDVRSRLSELFPGSGEPGSGSSSGSGSSNSRSLVGLT